MSSENVTNRVKKNPAVVSKQKKDKLVIPLLVLCLVTGTGSAVCKTWGDSINDVQSVNAPFDCMHSFLDFSIFQSAVDS